jgi:hypothetical protein
MGLVGVLTNGLFLMLILAGFLPLPFLTECGRSL